MGLGSLDRDAANGVQSAGNEAKASFPTPSLSDRAIAADSAVGNAPRLLISSPSATDGAPSATTATNALRDYQRNAPDVDASTQYTPTISPPALTIPRRVTSYERFLKPLIDRVLACVLLVALSPLLLVVAVLVAISLGRPIVLRQRRVGRDGKLFVLHKFRTMHPDRRNVGNTFAGGDRRRTHKHPDDPRLTPVGRALRKWSLDELPQLWDVVTGKLSLVGPRPELESIVAKYEPWQHARHAVKPGLTGLWQITARGDGEMHEHTDLDIEYAQNVTLRGDLRIMILTIPAILSRKGY